MSPFEQRKERILRELAVPIDTYSDASPKGSVDEGIFELVQEINGLHGLVTTSSCAGRIAIYSEGLKSSSTEGDERAPTSTSTGKGGGKWLFVSHEPVPLEAHTSPGSLRKLFGLPPLFAQPVVVTSTSPSFVHFKFEPMILHILCSSLSIARKTLAAAQNAGFRESGIGSINDEQDMVMVAVRSSGLAFDSIIAASNRDDDIRTLVTEDYLHTLTTVANERFEVNAARKSRFRVAMLALSERGEPQDARPGWEPAEQRRKRLREEGLKKQHDLQMQSMAEKEGNQEDVLDDFGLSSM